MTAQIASGDRVQHDPQGGLGTVEYVGPGENATVTWDTTGRSSQHPLRNLRRVPAWSPTVGARAIVAVAEWDDGTPSRLTAGDEGTLTALVKDDTSEWIVKRDDGRFGYVAARHLRPAPVAPAPDQDDEPAGLPWRVGGSYNLHAYADEPWAVDPSKDRPVATFHRPADAALAVERVNAHAALTARAERAEAEAERLNYGLKAATKRVDVLREEVRRKDVAGYRARQSATRRERLIDGLRAELAAAGTTDGLGLPEVKVQRGQDTDGTKAAWLTLVADWEKHYSINDAEPLWLLRERAAVALALLRDAVDRDRAAPTCDDEARAVYASLHGGDYWDDAEESSRQQYREAAAAGRAVRARLAQEAPTTKDDDR